ncbi:MAG TPA: hypothetical protein VG388_01685 [Solirubrobacteraceae bacterium]|nr:hypothetical protein [Solirubrobacteraceae bacterium]
MSTSSSTTGSSPLPRQLWGVRARDWAEGMEGQTTPLYEAVLARIGLGQGTEVLDAGCGAGLAAQIARRSRSPTSTAIPSAPPSCTSASRRTSGAPAIPPPL